MKELIKKITVILVLMIMLINSSLLLIISNAVDGIEKIIDESKINPLYEMNLEKYVNYDTVDDKGVLIQINLKTGIEYGENEEYKPLNSTGILLNLPKIENEYPESVEVIGKSTKATNGSDNAKDFRYIYDKENGTVKLATVNEKDDNGNIYNEKVDGARDEYTIICYYGSNCYNNENAERNLDISGFVQSNIANETEIKKKKEIEQNYTVTDNVSGLVSTEVKTSDIYNGYINSNSKNDTTYETEYTENLEIDISKKELSDEIKIDTISNFINKDNEEKETDEIVYKSTRIYKNEILDILGENGYLQILNENGDVLGEVNKDTEVDENGIYEITYSEDVNKIIIKASKPVQLGTIMLQNVKKIKSSMKNTDFSKIIVKSNISCINKVEEKVENEETKAEETKVTEKEIYNFKNENEVEIKNSETRVDLSVDKTDWTNNVQNDVVFTATLVTDNEKSALQENPVIDIKLPTEVENVILGDVSLLYNNGLSIKNINVIDKDNCKLIRVELDGNQKEYFINSMIQGTNVIIPATIIVKKDIDSVATNIDVSYTNNNAMPNDYNNDGKECKQIGITIDSIKARTYEAEDTQANFVALNDEGNNVSSEAIETKIVATLGEQELKDGQDIHEHEYVKYSIKIKNNSNSKVDDIKVLGTVPDGTTYVNCYFGEYSYNEDDLYRTEENNTKKEYNEIISLEGGQETELNYYIRANYLDDDQTKKEITNNIAVYIGENKINEYITKNNIKPAEMEIKLNAREITRDDYTWIYAIKLTNNTDKIINDSIINMNLADKMKFAYIDENQTYTANKTKNGVQVKVPTLNANETKTINLYMTIDTDDDRTEYEVNTVASVVAKDTDTYYSNINKEKIYIAKIEVIQTSEKEGKELEINEEVEYDFVIKNISNENINNKKINLEIIGDIDSNFDGVSIEYENFVQDSEKNQYNKKVYNEKLEIKEIFDNNESNEDEETDESTEDLSDIYLTTTIPCGEQINVKVILKAKYTEKDVETTNCLKVRYDYYGEHSVTSNIIKNKILAYKEDQEIKDNDDIDSDSGNEPDIDKDYDNDKYDPSGDNKNNDDNNNSNNDNKGYSISGFAWEDVDKNGKADDGERKFNNITVKLFNHDTNEIVKDSNGNKFETKTNSAGEYEFNNVADGRYLVLFEYDNVNYLLTTYKKEGVSEGYNSDVIEKVVSIDNVEKNVAVTDILQTGDINLNYINIGLVKREKFDLSLNKSITKVIANYAGTSKTYEYNESKLAKIEIPSKSIQGANIVVEYQLEVKNEGDIDGYVDEIVDYLPEGFNFDSELNEGWTKNSNGTLKNTSLLGVKIQTGESKKIKLYLTRNLSSNSIGLLTNSAEILKSNSVNGSKDIDSINANNNETEDDYSKAELLISIKTGAFMYISVIIVIIGAILLVLKILNNKNIINIKKLRCFSVIFMLMFIIFACNYSYAGGESDATYNEYTNAEAKEYIKKYHNFPSSVGCYYDSYDWSKTHVAGCQWDITEERTEYNSETKKDETVIYYKCHIAHGYIHHGQPRVAGQLYCTDGNKMAEGSGNQWTYSPTKDFISLTVNNIKEADRKDVAEIYNNSSNPEFLGFDVTPDDDTDYADSKYFLVGPYNVKFNGSYNGIEVYVKLVNGTKIVEKKLSDSEFEIVDKNGNLIVNSSNKQVVKKERNFYIKIEKSINLGEGRGKKPVAGISKVIVKNTKIGRLKFLLSYTYDEKWTTPHDGAQILGREGEEEITTIWLRRRTYNQVELKGVDLPLGTLIIEKRDIDTNELIKGAKVNIKDEKYFYNKNKQVKNKLNLMVIDDSQWEYGRLIIKNIPAGWYTIEEILAADGYKLSLQGEDGTIIKTRVKVKETKIKKGEVVGETKVVLYNKQYGNLIINKIDRQTRNRYLEELNFKDVEFVIQFLENDNKYIKTYEEVAGRPARITYTTNIEEAYKFKTNEDGILRLMNIPVGTYIIKEYSLPNEMAKYYDVKQYLDIADVRTNVAGFRIYIKNGSKKEYISAYDKNESPPITETSKSEKDAKFFRAGTILKNLPTGTYYIEEVDKTIRRNIEVISTETYQVTNKTNEKTLTSKLNGYTIKDVENQQVRIDIEGYVWEDKADPNKTTTRDNIYTTSENPQNPDTRYDVYKTDGTTYDIGIGSDDPTKTGVRIPVYLKKNGTVIAVRYTGNYGRYFFEAKGASGLPGRENEIYTIDLFKDDENKLTATPGNGLRQYTIEFEYNGLKYESVLSIWNQDENLRSKPDELKSKADEIQSVRDSFNNNFSLISERTEKDGNGISQGVTRNGTGLTYNTPSDYTSNLVQNTEYTQASLLGDVDPTSAATMIATTPSNENLTVFSWTPGLRTIRHMNFGMYEREQPDIAIATDIDNIELNINGYAHVYKYGQRASFIQSGVPDTIDNPTYDAAMDGFSVGVKNNAGNYKNQSYVRHIYDSYIAYTEKQEGDNRLKVYVTYKIAVKNESSSLVTKVSLRNYADARYGSINKSYVDDESNVVNWTKTEVNNELNKWTTNGVINRTIPSGECMYVYLQYELKRDAILEMVQLDKNNDQGMQLKENTTEINAYEVFDRNNSYYGGIDKDSAPGNIRYSQFITYEDDTDAAPNIEFKRKSSKMIDGLVFEDNPEFGDKQKLHTKEERIGNGQYDEGENTVKDVKVEIIDVNNSNETANVYKITDNGEVTEDKAIEITGDNGKYVFEGLIPGQYQIKYTYGNYENKQTIIKGESDIQVTTQDYKSTIVNSDKFKDVIENSDESLQANFDIVKNSSALWYWYEKTDKNSTTEQIYNEYSKSSSAVDDYIQRQKINDNLKDINYKVKTDYENKQDKDLQYMTSNTGTMDLAVEDYQNQSTDFGYDSDYLTRDRKYELKFGIIERPRQSLQVNKEIDNICLTLSNGQILAQGDPRKDNMNYVTYPDSGPLKIEVDSEIVEGATLDIDYKISVENRSELDYNTIGYYRYGEDKNSLVIIESNSIIADYADEKLSITYDIDEENSEFVYYDTNSNKTKWNIVTNTSETNSLAGISIDSKVYDSIKNRKNNAVKQITQAINPGEVTRMNLKAKKLLSNLSSEDFIFDNYVEFIQVSNSIGRFYGEIDTNESWKLRTPGNFDINSTQDTNECDNSNYGRYENKNTHIKIDENDPGENNNNNNNGKNPPRDAKLVIVPPTGENIGTVVIYSLIGVLALIVLSSGIILIKKKVLK